MQNGAVMRDCGHAWPKGYGFIGVAGLSDAELYVATSVRKDGKSNGS